MALSFLASCCAWPWPGPDRPRAHHSLHALSGRQPCFSCAWSSPGAGLLSAGRAPAPAVACTEKQSCCWLLAREPRRCCGPKPRLTRKHLYWRRGNEFAVAPSLLLCTAGRCRRLCCMLQTGCGPHLQDLADHISVARSTSVLTDVWLRCHTHHCKRSSFWLHMRFRSTTGSIIVLESATYQSVVQQSMQTATAMLSRDLAHNKGFSNSTTYSSPSESAEQVQIHPQSSRST